MLAACSVRRYTCSSRLARSTRYEHVVNMSDDDVREVALGSTASVPGTRHAVTVKHRVRAGCWRGSARCRAVATCCLFMYMKNRIRIDKADGRRLRLNDDDFDFPNATLTSVIPSTFTSSSPIRLKKTWSTRRQFSLHCSCSNWVVQDIQANTYLVRIMPAKHSQLTRECH